MNVSTDSMITHLEIYPQRKIKDSFNMQIFKYLPFSGIFQEQNKTDKSPILVELTFQLEGWKNNEKDGK